MEKRNVQNCTFLRSSNIHVQLNKVRIVKKNLQKFITSNKKAYNSILKQKQQYFLLTKFERFKCSSVFYPHTFKAKWSKDQQPCESFELKKWNEPLSDDRIDEECESNRRVLWSCSISSLVLAEQDSLLICVIPLLSIDFCTKMKILLQDICFSQRNQSVTLVTSVQSVSGQNLLQKLSVCPWYLMKTLLLCIIKMNARPAMWLLMVA